MIPSLKPSIYYQKTFSGITLSKKSIKEKEFERCRFIKLHLTDCKVEKCKFFNCIFDNCILSAIKPFNSIFNEVEFKAINYLIDIKSNIITKAHFSYPEAINLLKCLDITVEY